MSVEAERNKGDIKPLPEPSEETEIALPQLTTAGVSMENYVWATAHAGAFEQLLILLEVKYSTSSLEGRQGEWLQFIKNIQWGRHWHVTYLIILPIIL